MPLSEGLDKRGLNSYNSCLLNDFVKTDYEIEMTQLLTHAEILKEIHDNNKNNNSSEKRIFTPSIRTRILH